MEFSSQEYWNGLPFSSPGDLPHPGIDGKASAYNAGDPGSIPGWGRSIPWRRKWWPTPVLLPGKSHRRRSLVGYSPWGRRVGHDWATLLTHSWLNHLLSFFTFPVCFKCQMTVKWSLNSSATSHAAVKRISFNDCSQLVIVNFRWLATTLIFKALLCKTSWTTTALYVC